MTISDKEFTKIPIDFQKRINSIITETQNINDIKQICINKVKGLGTSDATYGISDKYRKQLFNYGDDSPSKRYVYQREVSYEKSLFFKNRGTEDPHKRIITEYVYTKVKSVNKWVFYRIFYTTTHYNEIFRVKGKKYTGEIKNL